MKTLFDLKTTACYIGSVEQTITEHNLTNMTAVCIDGTACQGSYKGVQQCTH